MIYLLNSPVLSSYGVFHFSGPLSLAEARNRLTAPYFSAIGHPVTASKLTRLLGVDVPMNRIRISMAQGDCALVLRMLDRDRLPEGKIISNEAELDFELAWLERLE